MLHSTTLKAFTGILLFLSISLLPARAASASFHNTIVPAALNNRYSVNRSSFLIIKAVPRLPSRPGTGFRYAQTAGYLLPTTLDTVPNYLFFAGLSPAMIGQDQWELNLYNALTTQKFIPAVNQQEVNRNTGLQQALQVWHNPFASSRVNVGVGVRLGHVLVDTEPDRSPLRVLGGADEQSIAYHAFTAIGPSVRFIPVRTLPELSIQSSFLLPVAKDLATRQALGWDRAAFLLQGAFQQQLSPWLYGFLSTGATLFFKNDDRMQTTLSIPAALYLAGRIAYSDWYVLADLSYSSAYNDRFEGPLRKVSSQWLAGLGVQYYLSSRWTVLLLWERSLGMNLVGSSTEFINESFNQVSLGVRYLTW